MKRSCFLALSLFLLLSVNSQFIGEVKELSPEDKAKIDNIFFQMFEETLYPLSQVLQNNQKKESCEYCTIAIMEIREQVIKQYSFEGVIQFLQNLCKYILDEDVCVNAIEGYAPILFYQLIDKLVDEKQICSSLNLCEEEKYIDVDDYARRVLADKPEKEREKINPEAKTWRMLQMTDLHYDLNYVEGSRAQCNKPLCCREPLKPGDTEIAGKFGYPGACDINENVFLSFLDAAEESKPDFIIWTGDNAPHDVWAGSQEHVYKSTEVLKEMVNKKFQHKIPIFPILGNHEKYPNDEFTLNEGPLLQKMADLYKEYLDDQAYETFRKYGYYTMLLPGSNLRIVALNCMVCDTWNLNLMTVKSQAQQQFDWLEGVLREAEKNGEIVYILDHIPMNASFYLTQCAKRMKALIERFNYIIRGHFSGHTHVDDIITVRSYFDKDKITSINYVAPCLSTYSHHYPSFRVYEIDSDTKLVKDYEQYRLNVTEANIKGFAKWNLSHKATELFNITDLTEVDKIASFNPEGEYIFKRYGETEDARRKMHKKKEIKSAKCTITTDNLQDFVNCAYPKLSFNQFWLCKLIDNLSGPWKEKY